jgi:hypothetical protein
MGRQGRCRRVRKFSPTPEADHRFVQPVACRRRFDTTEEMQAESQRVLDTDRKGLRGSVPETEETVGPVSYMCEGTTSRVVSADRPYGALMVFTSSVRNILDTPSYG